MYSTMFATVVVVCPSGSSVSASIPTAILSDVGAAACPPRGTPTSVSPTTNASARIRDGRTNPRFIILPPLRTAMMPSPRRVQSVTVYAFMPSLPSPPRARCAQPSHGAESDTWMKVVERAGQGVPTQVEVLPSVLFGWNRGCGKVTRRVFCLGFPLHLAGVLDRKGSFGSSPTCHRNHRSRVARNEASLPPGVAQGIQPCANLPQLLFPGPRPLRDLGCPLAGDEHRNAIFPASIVGELKSEETTGRRVDQSGNERADQGVSIRLERPSERTGIEPRLLESTGDIGLVRRRECAAGGAFFGFLRGLSRRIDLAFGGRSTGTLTEGFPATLIGGDVVFAQHHPDDQVPRVSDAGHEKQDAGPRQSIESLFDVLEQSNAGSDIEEITD